MGEQIIKLHHLRPAEGSKKKAVRVGRGESGRRGKTAGRGTKGQKARNNTRVGFEGGQMPMARRIPKMKGFRNPFRVTYNVVNLDVLAQFPAGSEVTPATLKERGLVHHKGLVKVLGNGELTHALDVRADAFSKSAADKIRAAGGTAEVVEAAAEGVAQAAATVSPGADVPAGPSDDENSDAVEPRAGTGAEEPDTSA